MKWELCYKRQCSIVLKSLYAKRNESVVQKHKTGDILRIQLLEQTKKTTTTNKKSSGNYCRKWGRKKRIKTVTKDARAEERNRE